MISVSRSSEIVTPSTSGETRDLAIDRGALSLPALTLGEYERMIAGIPGMVYRLVRRSDGALSFRYVSEGCVDLLGLERSRLLVEAECLLRAVHPDDRESFRTTLSGAAKAGGRWQWEGRVLIPAAGAVHGVEEKWLHTAAQPELGAAGESTWSGIMLDVTTRILAERRFTEFSGDLERSTQALQEFAFAASHDLQDPLRKVRVFADMLRETCGKALDSDGRFLLERIAKSAERGQRLIRDLLTLSRVATQPCVSSDVDLEGIARAIAAEYVDELREEIGAISVHSLPTLQADPLQMELLFRALLDNAVKYRRRETPLSVQIRSRSIPDPTSKSGVYAQEHTWCEISVQDNGAGFAPQAAARIFEPFARLHGMDAFEGSGIGLTVCRKIVERHAGRIWAEGEAGCGARVFIQLPRHAAR